jgi:methylase of polypeptide subunit release factors
MLDLESPVGRRMLALAANDEEGFLREQSRLSAAERRELRQAPRVAQICFGLEWLEGVAVSSNYWDATTLCMRKPLLEHASEARDVLEIGPGPSATLSLYLGKNVPRLRLKAAELQPEFVVSARTIAASNGVSLDIRESDQTSSFSGQKFDLVFMNPPYVKEGIAAAIGAEPTSSHGRATFGGIDGCAVLEGFLAAVPDVLVPGGTALVGINNWHLEDEVVIGHIARSRLRLRRRYYPPERVAPHGPYSQVYVLELE